MSFRVISLPHFTNEAHLHSHPQPLLESIRIIFLHAIGSGIMGDSECLHETSALIQLHNVFKMPSNPN